MAFLKDLLGRNRGAGAGPASAAPAAWAVPLFQTPLTAAVADASGHTLVWTVEDAGSTATITDQFKAGAEEYHRRYAASDHFERLFRQAVDQTAIAVAPAPLILDIGSGSGVNSVVPCRRLFDGARIVATDLSGELLAMLGAYARDSDLGDAVACVRMDAMSDLVTPAAFDLVTGASILHHLLDPEQGIAAAGRALKPGGHAIFFEPFHGWALMRLAYERILAEAALRGDPLDPAVEAALAATVRDVAARTDPDPDAPWFAHLDDKWLFSRARITEAAQAAGFAEVRFVPHADKPMAYQNVALVNLRLATGRDDLGFPDWATAILASFDAALTRDAKRELAMEAAIVLTKAA